MSGRGPYASLAHAAAVALDTRVESISPCAGGDISLAFRLDLADGRAAFLKTRPGAGADEFRFEAAGLRWLAEPGGLGVPDPLAVIDDGPHAGLLIEWVEPGGPLSPAGQEEFGRGLARIHTAGAEAHGVVPPGAPGRDLRLGKAVLVSPADPGPETSFAAVYVGRIDALARQAVDIGNLDQEGAAVLGRLSDRMEDLCGPPGPPARLHGDLWSGNVMAGPGGRPFVIDPAAYGGINEVDLAMLELFASPSPGFYAAYAEVRPLDPGYRERIPLWQVQPLLVHAVLFGGHYGSAAVDAASLYVD